MSSSFCRRWLHLTEPLLEAYYWQYESGDGSPPRALGSARTCIARLSRRALPSAAVVPKSGSFGGGLFGLIAWWESDAQSPRTATARDLEGVPDDGVVAGRPQACSWVLTTLRSTAMFPSGPTVMPLWWSSRHETAWRASSGRSMGG
jgi:hypothetical protein